MIAIDSLQASANFAAARDGQRLQLLIHGSDLPRSSPHYLAEFRVADSPGIATIDVRFDKSDRSESAIVQAFRDALTDVFEPFHKDEGALDGAVDAALEGLSDLVKKAIENNEYAGVQARIASIYRSFGGEDSKDTPGFERAGSISEFAVETGLVKDDKVARDDVGLVTLAGSWISMPEAHLRAGLIGGLYRAPGSLGSKGSDEDNGALHEIRAALERLREVQQALAAYRKGDNGPLERLIRGDTAADRALDTLGKLRIHSESTDDTDAAQIAEGIGSQLFGTKREEVA